MNREIAFQKMYDTFDALKAMPEAEWLAMHDQLELMTVPKKHVLQAAGKYSRVHYFVVEGLVRYYYLGVDGKEHNKAFYDKGHIVGSLSAIILNEPSRYSIETIEPCTLIALPMESSASEELFNYGCQMMLVRNERREAELLTMSAKERFLQFHRNFPSYFDRIPQYQIASYLGITPVALSRYKGQWFEEQST